MQMIRENTELGTNQPGIDFAVDGVVDTQWTKKRMYLENFNVLLHRSRTTIKTSA